MPPRRRRRSNLAESGHPELRGRPPAETGGLLTAVTESLRHRERLPIFSLASGRRFLLMVGGGPQCRNAQKGPEAPRQAE